MLSKHQEIVLESINNNLADILKELRANKHPKHHYTGEIDPKNITWTFAIDNPTQNS